MGGIGSSASPSFLKVPRGGSFLTTSWNIRSQFLTYKLQIGGFPIKAQFQTIREAWTSKTCYKCGATDTYRPFQSLVICRICGAQLQADVNGALNIGLKLIASLADSIRPTFDHWLTNPISHWDSEGSGAEAFQPSFEGASLTSSARSGHDTASAVPVVVESANFKPSRHLKHLAEVR